MPVNMPNCKSKHEMMHSLPITIQEVVWEGEHQAALRAIREQVFIIEQQVPVALEWDALDAQAQHLLACNAQGKALGCARVVDGHHIGRMAVLKPWRKQGVGMTLLKQAIAICQHYPITLSAQKQVTGFYEQAGFYVASTPYLDANIWHVDMQRDI